MTPSSCRAAPAPQIMPPISCERAVLALRTRPTKNTQHPPETDLRSVRVDAHFSEMRPVGVDRVVRVVRIVAHAAGFADRFDTLGMVACDDRAHRLGRVADAHGA